MYLITKMTHRIPQFCSKKWCLPQLLSIWGLFVVCNGWVKDERWRKSYIRRQEKSLATNFRHFKDLTGIIISSSSLCLIVNDTTVHWVKFDIEDGHLYIYIELITGYYIVNHFLSTRVLVKYYIEKMFRLSKDYIYQLSHIEFSLSLPFWTNINIAAGIWCTMGLCVCWKDYTVQQMKSLCVNCFDFFLSSNRRCCSRYNRFPFLECLRPLIKIKSVCPLPTDPLFCRLLKKVYCKNQINFFIYFFLFQISRSSVFCALIFALLSGSFAVLCATYHLDARQAL